MARNFDHVTIVVRDVDDAKRFFGLLGFEETQSAIISGQEMAAYMGVPGIEAEHVTLVLRGSSPHNEIQLLRYHHPDPLPDPGIRDLTKLGFNHVCLAVDDLAAELRKLEQAGFRRRNDVMEFHDRKLVFLVGPEGITIELAQWC